MFNTDHYHSRFFNQVTDTGETVVKKSDNVEKILSEYRFYYMLPDHLKRFFVQPFNLNKDETTAAYEMEKIRVENAAERLISGKMSQESFRSLMYKISLFQAEAGLVKSTKEEVTAQANYLVIEKTEARLKGLGYESQIDRLKTAFSKYLSERTTWNTAISHGDLCFSNMLWVEEIEMLKLIDPRGAIDTSDMLLDEYYDLAKLSHSIFSGYEVMVYGFGKVPEFASEILTEYLTFRGASLNLLRVYEAALFLSMIPLHSDSPERVEAFTKTAEDILSSIGF